MKQALIRIDGHLRTRMRVVIWKQWKTREKRIWGLRKLGAPEWMAKQSAGFGDHYQAVAKTTGLRLINKEILANDMLPLRETVKNKTLLIAKGVFLWTGIRFQQM
jgi:hypothetical protein